MRCLGPGSLPTGIGTGSNHGEPGAAGGIGGEWPAWGGWGGKSELAGVPGAAGVRVSGGEAGRYAVAGGMGGKAGRPEWSGPPGEAAGGLLCAFGCPVGDSLWPVDRPTRLAEVDGAGLTSGVSARG